MTDEQVDASAKTTGRALFSQNGKGPGNNHKDKGGNLLYADVGGTMKMDGPEIYRRAVRVIVSSAQATLQRAGLEAADLDLLVPHQANQRIIDAACRRLGVPDEKVVSVLEHTGNTSAASIPYALAEAADQGRVADGALVLLVGFGAGMTGASALLRWGR